MMIIKLKMPAILALFLSLAWMAGCSKDGQRNSKATYLARVGSAYLTLDEARENIPHFAIKQDSAKAVATYRRQWVRRQLLLNKAEKLGLTNNKRVRQQLKKARDQVLINALQKSITTEFKKRSSVSDSEADQYFKKNEKKLVLNERFVSFRHIKTGKLSDARQARQELENDSTWTKVAHKYSLSPEESIQKSNRVWPVSAIFNRLPAMKRYVSTLDSGRISPIQRVESVYHFVQLTAVYKQGEPANAGWFTEQLKSWLMREKQRNYYNSYVKNLYLNAKEDNEIEVFNVSTPGSNENIDSTHTRKAHE